LVVLILIFLGIFQLAEYLICTATGIPGISWARIGYVSITLLPPLGTSLAMALAGKKSWPAQAVMYGISAAFITYFAFASNSLTGPICGGNYVIFTTRPGVTFWYAAYYYGMLAVTVFLCTRWAEFAKKKRVRRSLYALAAGYCAFIIPTITVGMLNADARQAIPSVMCGFAVILALVLLVFVLPSGGTKRRKP
jgi:hypothetical protein